MPWPNPEFPPFAPQHQQQMRRRGHGYVGWILTGVLGVAVFAATAIVVWPEKTPTSARTPEQPPPTPDTDSPGPSPEDSTSVLRKFWVDTFAAAEGYREPDNSGDPVGELRKGTHYVFCKREGTRVERNGQYNRWWLLTNLDEVYGGGGPRAYIPALYLKNWGNDEAKDNAGGEIPICPS